MKIVEQIRMSARQQREVENLEDAGWAILYVNSRNDVVMKRELRDGLNGFNMQTVPR